MSDRVFIWLPLLPALVPLLLAAAVLVMPGPRSIAALVPAGLLVAATALLPLAGMPQTTPLWQWATIDGDPLLFRLSLDGAAYRRFVSFLLLMAGAVGLWSAARLAAPRDDNGAWRSLRSPWATFVGLLVIIAGGQIAVLADARLLVVLGLGVLVLGSLLVSLAGASAADDGPLAAGALVFTGLGLLITAAFVDPALRGTAHLWLAGLALVIGAESLRLARDRAPLLLAGAATSIGLTPVGAWLLLADLQNGLLDLVLAPAILTALGLAAFILGALNAVAARSLRALLTAQWISQLGLLLLAMERFATSADVGGSLLAIATLANAILSTLLMSLMLGRLALLSDSEQIADLPPLATPLSRCGVAYALGVASAAGLPLTLGFTVRRSLVAAGAAGFIEPLLLAGSSLLLLALAAPLPAFFRRPIRPIFLPFPLDQSAAGGPLLGLLLVVGGLYDAFPSLLAPGGPNDARYWTAALRAGFYLLAALLMLALAIRALRRAQARPIWHGGVALDEEPGWALPFGALAGLLAAITPAPWAAASRRALPGWRQWASRMGAAERTVERRYYLALIVLATISIVLIAARGAGS